MSNQVVNKEELERATAARNGMTVTLFLLIAAEVCIVGSSWREFLSPVSISDRIGMWAACGFASLILLSAYFTVHMTWYRKEVSVGRFPTK